MQLCQNFAEEILGGFGVSNVAVRPRSLAYYPCFPVYWSNNFVPAEGVELLCCFDVYSQINLVSIKVMYLPRN